MKTPIKILSLLASLAVMATSATADSLKLSQDLANFSNGNGGAFIASDFTGPISMSGYSSLAKGDGGFLTFCIEYNEEFVPGWTYNYALSFGAKNGGLSGQGSTNYDGVSNATAYLYSTFAQGNLAGVGGFSYTKTSLGDLQQAIWFLEGEGGTNNLIAQAAETHEGATWNSDNNGAYGVQAINLYYQNGGNSQDQLYYHSVPDQGTTLALLGLAFLGLAGVRRKLARSA